MSSLSSNFEIAFNSTQTESSIKKSIKYTDEKNKDFVIGDIVDDIKSY